MSQGKDFALDDAYLIARKYFDALEPLCERRLIVGSVRRLKPVVHDIELLVIPIKMTKLDMFGMVTGIASMVDELLPGMVKQWGAEFVKNGPALKQIMLPEGLKLEICVSSAERWPVEAVIKTGPADFSRMVVTHRMAGGFLPNNCEIKNGWRLYQSGQLVELGTEREFVQFLFGRWIEPVERGALVEVA